MIRLLEARDGAWQSLLPPGREPGAWHAALTQEIAAHLSPAHAAVLGHPVRVANGMAWEADGQSRTRYADLPAQSRAALDHALGAILSDIRRLAESGVAPAVREAWPALREVPDLGHVFAVDGRPVLAAWGHASTGSPGRLGRFDDGIAWRAAPKPRWGLYGGLLGGLAAVALAAGLLLPLAHRWLVDAPPACTIVPAQLEAMRGQAEAENRGAELRTLLATLTEEIGRKQLLCPIAMLPQPAAPPAAPPAPPPAPPPPRADLPQERWNRQDLTMLDGCWDLTTNLFITSPDRNRRTNVRTLRLCFDGRGRGTQSAVLEDNRRCSGPLAASFGPEQTLVVDDEAPCRGPELSVGRSGRVCRRIGDTEAVCTGHGIDSPGMSYEGRFRRSATQ